MKIIALIAVGIFAAFAIGLFILFRQESLVFETYLIPSTMKEGWVTIELGNPKCPPLRQGRGWRELVIPESGYLCTSTPRNEKFFYDWYYLVDQNGKRTPLRYEQQIFQRHSIFLDALNPNCKVVADSFWYGSQEKLDNQDVLALKKRHPECSGVTFPIK